MLGDAFDMARRMFAVLPANWFAGAAPIVNAILNGFGTGMAAVYTLIQFTIVQSRILTAAGMFLDAISVDFFGSGLGRRAGEADTSFRVRISNNLLCGRGTRTALSSGLTFLTGTPPLIFEPSRTADTGGYAAGGVGYGVAGGWGNLNLPYQFFVTIFRPQGGGIAYLAGYGSGGVPVYGSLAFETTTLSDAALMAAVQPLLPAASIAWCRIVD